MGYTIGFTPRAAKELGNLPKAAQRQIAKRIDALAEDPTPVGAILIHAKRKRHRLRCGDHRVIYEVRKTALLVLVIRVGHRKEVYRNFE